MNAKESASLARIFLLLSLVAVLSGPLLRAAEGADDLVRSLAELDRPPLMEDVDGGVGDDSGAAIYSVDERLLVDRQSQRNPAGWSIAEVNPAIARLNQPLSSPSLFASEPFLGAADASTRQAWFQRFLF
jgi:hypothetical protein